MCEVVSVCTPRARVEHQCATCYGLIAPGEVYYRAAVVGDGRIWTWVEHPECATEANRWLRDEGDPEEGYPEGLLCERAGYTDPQDWSPEYLEYRYWRERVETGRDGGSTGILAVDPEGPSDGPL